MDEDLLTFLGEATLELRLPADDPNAGIIARAMLAQVPPQQSVAQVLAWDLGRLKEGNGKATRDDKVAYVAALRGPAGNQLGTSAIAPTLVGLLLDRVALTIKPPEVTQVDSSTLAKGDSADDLAERKRSGELYELFGMVAGLRLKNGLRDRHAAALYRNYREHGRLGGFISCSEVSTLGVKKRREQRHKLGVGSTLVINEGEADTKGHSYEDARRLGYIVSMLLAVVLTQEIPKDMYEGSELAGYEEVPAKGRIRLGLTFTVREELVQAIVQMGGTPAAYLARVDTIMDDIVNEIDKKSRHPDLCIRDYLHASAGLFILASPSAGPTAGSEKSGAVDKVKTGWCPGWIDDGTCRMPGGQHSCTMGHPNDKRGIAKQLKQARANLADKRKKPNAGGRPNGGGGGSKPANA